MSSNQKSFPDSGHLRLTKDQISFKLAANLKNPQIEQEFDLRYPYKDSMDEPIPASVLVPLLCNNNKNWHVLFTRRNENLPEHSGQVSFPGGRADPGDNSPEETALREACEEIGLKTSEVEILGRLPEFHTITNYLVTPIVGVIPWPYSFQIASEEVSRVFTIPLNWLSDPSNSETKYRQLNPNHSSIPVIYYRPYDGEILWGATARLTVHLVDILARL